MKYLVYDADGNILRKGVCQDSDFLLQARGGQAVIADVYDDTDDAKHFIDIATSKRVDKQQITATLSGATISGLPIPATITIQGVKYDVADGTANLSFNLPGTYSVLCEALHYFPKTFEVTV